MHDGDGYANTPGWCGRTGKCTVIGRAGGDQRRVTSVLTVQLALHVFLSDHDCPFSNHEFIPENGSSGLGV